MNKLLNSSFKITFIYVIFAGAWILFSDLIVLAIFDDPHRISQVQTLKGWLFVLTTALLLFYLVLKSHQKLDGLYQLDGLTGLLSHHTFSQQLTQKIKQRGEHQVLGVSILDINNFQGINSTIGFNRADQFLIRIARELELHYAADNIICRLPADQFALAGNFDAYDTLQEKNIRLEQLFRRVAESFGIDVRCRIGVAVYPGDGSDAIGLLQAANDALRAAKGEGNTIAYHDQKLAKMENKRRELVSDLKATIRNRELKLVYQPKYSTNSLEVQGVEVLLRWEHKTQRPISPAVFIPLAEENGLAHDITKVVIEKAAKELTATELLGSSLKHVSINVSAKEFNSGDMMDELLESLRPYPKLAELLRLEITETATLVDMKRSAKIIQKLRSQGIGFSIDDFGTGYTSLAMLKDLTIDEIKIDRSFIMELTEGDKSHTIVDAIIAMASKFDINVVAEGVETEQQLAFLRELGCKEVQGFYLSRPVSIETLQANLIGLPATQK